MNKSSKNVGIVREREREREVHFKQIKEKRGITLIALVVTIVVLLILAGITINMLFSNGGIFKTAQDAANAWNEATVNEQESLNNIADQIANLVNGQIGGGSGTEEPEDPTTGPNGKLLVDTITEIQTENNLEAEDKYGNLVVVPKGFKVVTSEGTTVPEGIVIEDINGNQFVWIPVGTVHKDNKPENDVTIKLGRYTFNTTNGTPTMQQAAFAGDNPSSPEQTYENEVAIESYYRELTTYRPGTVDNSNHLNDLNATAKNLAGFVQSVADNGGYYLARYEASYGSGYNSVGSTDAEKYANAKPLSKVSTANSTSSMTYDTPGKLWNYITQLNASKVSQNMYAGDSSVGVESDLVNSYAWDTAIVFIQNMKAENSNYANAGRDETENSSLMNTGETGDKVCNIFDMAANLLEWTTEYSTNTNSSRAYPCIVRGGGYDYNILYTANRNYDDAIDNGSIIGFRVSLYIK